MHVVIADFGVSRVTTQLAHDVNTSGIGTPLYMAPEVETGVYNDKADVYSFSILLWEVSHISLEGIIIMAETNQY